MAPIISVIVPVYNAEKTVERCISSIQKQDYPYLEILVVVDGATDSSLNICRKMEEQDDRIKIFTIDNHGVSYARNLALSHAVGEYVGFVDSDDWIESEMYRCMMDCALKYSADVVIQSIIFDGINKAKSYSSTDAVTEMDGRSATIEMLRGRMFSGHLCNKLIRRSCVSMPLCDTNVYVYEDLYALWNILPNCRKVVFQEKYCYHYVMQQNSAMHQAFNPRSASAIIVADEICRSAEKEFPEAMPYARRMALLIYRNQVHRAFRSRKESSKRFDEEYKRFQEYSEMYFSQDVRCIMGRSERCLIWIEKSGKILFLIYWYLHWQISVVKNCLITVLHR